MKRILLGVLCAFCVALSASAADAAFYDSLPFPDIFPLPAGPAGAKEIKLGFSQTGFNHPWRIEKSTATRTSASS